MSSGTWHSPVPEQTRHMIAVGAAQPGVGKSVVASNLAVALASRGQKVVLVDLDPRTPRLAALMGATGLRGTLDVWLAHKRDGLDATPAATRVRNLRLLPYAGAAELGAGGHRAIVEALADLDGDVVIVDLGSDNRGDLFDCFASHALRLIVTPGDRAGLEASYAFLKTAALRAERRHGAGARAVLERFQGGMVGNLIAGADGAESLHAFSRLVREHLGIPLPLAACLAHSDRIPQSIAARAPLVARRGVDGNVSAFHHLADWALAGAVGPVRECALDGEDISLAPEPLPAELGRYVRRHPRFPVDWVATLEVSGGFTAVRVRDISASGVGVEATLVLNVGDDAVLHLDQMPGKPALPVQVKGVVPSLRRMGLSFLAVSDAVARLVETAQTAGRV
jgi:MinD-like ATPase involved in chromosome partitioning or flagellar assembly